MAGPGSPDILRKVKGKSKFGDWSYEVTDTKLAKETRAGTMLQLCLYCECLEEIQATMPEKMYVVTPGDGFVTEEFRVLDYMAYYRLVKGQLFKTCQSAVTSDTYPEPVSHCDVCRWWKVCDTQRRQDDHLSIVAGLSKLHTRELESHKIDTVANLAKHSIPFNEKFKRGNAQAL